jgi:hypothetical protein
MSDCSLSLNGIRLASPRGILGALRFNALRGTRSGAAAIDAFVATVATVMGRSLRTCQELALWVSAGSWTRHRCAETTQSDYGRPLASVRMIVLFVPHAAG